ncbi:AMP-binding protein [Agrobacterium rhizogenes]|nr:AMP-binding protein [Rhizobium rhizogenes]
MGVGHRLPFSKLPSTMYFSTSGSTGTPKIIAKTLRQVDLEVAAVSGYLPAPPNEVISFAPVNHAFGFFCGLALALRRGIPYQYRPISSGIGPITPPERNLLILALPAAYKAIERDRDKLSGNEHTTILQSGGPISTAYVDTVIDVANLAVEGVEIYGSTETGAIAHRRTSLFPNDWELFSDVEVLPNRTETDLLTELIVSGPRCVQPRTASAKAIMNGLPHIRTGDLVRFTEERQFTLCGRLDRVIQINGANTDLDFLQEFLNRRFSQAEFYVAAASDTVRGTGFVVHFHCRGSQFVIQQFRREIARALHEEFSRNVYPLDIHYSTAPFRKSSAGKITGISHAAVSNRMDVA